MVSFLSAREHRKDQLAARIVICVFALIFLLCAALSALPSFDSLSSFLSDSGLAGYAAVSEAEDNAATHSEVLEQFTDRPIESGTSTPITAEESKPIVPIEMPVKSAV